MKNLKIKIFKTKKNQKLLRILIKFQKCWPNSRISTKLNHFGPLGEPRIAHTSENGPKHKLTLLNFASLRWSGVLLASLASDLNSALQGSCACIFVAGTSTLEEQCIGWWRGQGELQPAQHLWSPPSILQDLKCLKNPRHVVAYILAVRVISTTICACRISWLVTRVFYLCLEPSVFRLLNKYFGFSGRAKKKKKLFCKPQFAGQSLPPSILSDFFVGLMGTWRCP